MHDKRKIYRRTSTTRRIDDRRKNPNAFGSIAWLENIKHYYLALPKFDRRQDSRRSDDRRAAERRRYPLPEHRFIERNYTENLLTREERTMIEYLYLMDDEIFIAS